MAVALGPSLLYLAGEKPYLSLKAFANWERLLKPTRAATLAMGADSVRSTVRAHSSRISRINL